MKNIKHLSSANLGGSCLYEYHMLKVSAHVWLSLEQVTVSGGQRVHTCIQQVEPLEIHEMGCPVSTWSQGCSYLIRIDFIASKSEPFSCADGGDPLLPALIRQPFLCLLLQFPQLCLQSFFQVGNRRFIFSTPAGLVLQLTHRDGQAGRVHSYEKIDIFSPFLFLSNFKFLQGIGVQISYGFLIYLPKSAF